MRTAICLYGLPRGSKKNWKSILYHADKLDADIYIHTWFNPGNVKNHLNVTLSNDYNLSEYVAFFSKSNRIKNILIERQIQYTPHMVETSWGKVFFSNQINSLISINCAINLVENDTSKYDKLIITRSDVYISKDVNISSDLVISHGGYFNNLNSRWECEDIYFSFPYFSKELFAKILKNHFNHFYYNNSIYNIFLYEFEKENLNINSINNNSGSLIYIVRKSFLLKNVINILKKCFDKFKSHK